ncbi:helix-turn-helix domain-containing protein [Mariniflexile gromovii]|uniref:Helix-turn-helix transcriptional regulator n=1 Tax=Mariniflexile gromovii TaxID=362523 RepID=A0ABS4BPH6_9FLAO|nr:helix-turn-helix transcriptional regulator [Mariniflexile gromovii]MBP0902492.1 helix-turn-helix transcriptional regulator [Mariniflexile gromovii]
MINTEDFTKRLQQVIDYYGESASSFAEKIGVQRSSISHILSGRNKPSLEFVLKILSAFPEVELYWLLNGKGEFPSTKKAAAQNLSSITSVPSPSPKIEKEIESKINHDKTIERIVIFYSDGSFKNFQN